MRISIFGFGYVGAVTGACMARDGHDVLAVDINPAKVNILNAGCSPIVEPGLDELIDAGVRTNRLKGTTNVEEAIATTDLSLICVGTPSAPNGSINTSYIERTCRQIGRALARKREFHAVVVRSTVLPGTTQKLLIPTIEKSSGKKSGKDFGIAYFPEFLREGSAIQDFGNPGSIVIGVLDTRTRNHLLDIHKNFDVEPQVLSISAAEAIKYANNSWHALKISFANEMGRVCKAFGVDSFEVMETLCQDTKLNISPAYLRPGFAFGGSCLPKDVQALRYGARIADVDTPLLKAVLSTNENQIEKAFRMIAETGLRRVGLIGLSFKPKTDDLRNSPFVALAERLLGRGFDLKIFDPIIYQSYRKGTNRQYFLQELPHLVDRLVETGGRLLGHSQVIVIGNREHAKPLIDNGNYSKKTVVDLVRIERTQRSSGLYHGICW